MNALVKKSLILGCVGLLLSCSDNITDKFIGDFILYQEYPIGHINCNELDAKEGSYNLLGEVQLHLYQNKNTKDIKGKGSIEIISIDPWAKTQREIYNTLELKVTYSYVEDDTLWLLLNDDIHCFMLEENDSILFGVPNDFCTTTPNNPSFVDHRGDYNMMHTYASTADVVKYLHHQIEELEELIELKKLLLKDISDEHEKIKIQAKISQLKSIMQRLFFHLEKQENTLG